MKKLIYSAAFLFVFFGCKNETSQKKTESETKTETKILKKEVLVNKVVLKNTERSPYFKANGNEPFWNLQIYDSIIVFKTIEDSIKMPPVQPIIAADNNVRTYKIETELAHFNIEISHQECINTMSDMRSPYMVSINYKKTIEKELKHIEGCGEYITDYRLHDIWVLEELNGNKITKDDFSEQFPSMEIDASANKFFGFAGCNKMNGMLFFEKDLLRFTNIVTTKMMCDASNKETEFLQALQSTTSYIIENNRLSLSNPDGTKLVFKKID